MLGLSVEAVVGLLIGAGLGLSVLLSILSCYNYNMYAQFTKNNQKNKHGHITKKKVNQHSKRERERDRENIPCNNILHLFWTLLLSLAFHIKH